MIKNKLTIKKVFKKSIHFQNNKNLVPKNKPNKLLIFSSILKKAKLVEILLKKRI